MNVPKVGDKIPILKRNDVKKVNTGQITSPKRLVTEPNDEVIDSLKMFFTSKELRKCYDEDNARKQFELDLLEANRNAN